MGRIESPFRDIKRQISFGGNATTHIDEVGDRRFRCGLREMPKCGVLWKGGVSDVHCRSCGEPRSSLGSFWISVKLVFTDIWQDLYCSNISSMLDVWNEVKGTALEELEERALGEDDLVAASPSARNEQI